MALRRPGPHDLSMSPTRTDPEPAAPPEPRLRRRVDERVVAGVAAGIARYLSLPVWLVRGAFVTLSIFLGLGLWLYILAAFAMPPEGMPSPDAPIDRVARLALNAPWWAWAALAVPVLLLIGAFAGWGRRGSLAAGVALVVAGAAVLAPRRDRVTGKTELPASATISSVPPERHAAPSPPRRRRKHSMLGWITVGVAIAAEGFVALLDRSGAADVEPQQYLALPVLILGAGMLVGARWGRAKWLTIPALLLMPPLLLASVIEVPFSGGYADRVARPQTVAEVRPEYRLAGGQWSIDLRDVSVEGNRPLRVSAQVAIGSIDVFVPASSALELRVAADWGYIDLRTWSGSGTADEYGFQMDLERSLPGRRKAGTIVLDLRVGIGSVRVFRGYPDTYLA